MYTISSNFQSQASTHDKIYTPTRNVLFVNIYNVVKSAFCEEPI